MIQNENQMCEVHALDLVHNPQMPVVCRMFAISQSTVHTYLRYIFNEFRNTTYIPASMLCANSRSV